MSATIFSKERTGTRRRRLNGSPPTSSTFPTRFYGPENNFCGDRGIPKNTGLIPMYSRDGYNFSRPSRRTFIGSSMYRGAWDRGYVQSVGGVTIIHGDELWIYYIAFAGDERYSRLNCRNLHDMESGMYMNGATGIAKLIRDGFVCLVVN